MAKQVFSAPNAVVYIDGKRAGFIQSISWSENFNRQEVKGLGSLYAQQVPVVGAGGTFQIGSFHLSFEEEGTKALLNRVNPTRTQMLDTLSLNEFPFSIVIFEKISVAKDDTNRFVTETDNTGFKQVQLDQCYIDSQSFSISENGIASLNTSGRFLQPMVVAKQS